MIVSKTKALKLQRNGVMDLMGFYVYSKKLYEAKDPYSHRFFRTDHCCNCKKIKIAEEGAYSGSQWWSLNNYREDATNGLYCSRCFDLVQKDLHKTVQNIPIEYEMVFKPMTKPVPLEILLFMMEGGDRNIMKETQMMMWDWED